MRKWSHSELSKRNQLWKKQIIEQAFDLKCENCGRKYDYYKFDDGSEFKHGCDCEMIEYAKQSTENYHKRETGGRSRTYIQAIDNERDLTAKRLIVQSNQQPTRVCKDMRTLCKQFHVRQ